MSSLLRIDLLGGLRVYPQGRPDLAVTRFSTQKAASLLAYLASHPRRIHPREELADRFWPGAKPDAGRASLRAALAALRRQLEPPGTPAGTILITDRLSARLNPLSFETDVTAFESALKRGDLISARDIYRGELLPGLYDEWVLQERERLISLYEEVEEGTDPDIRETPEAIASVQTVSVTSMPLIFTRCFGREMEIATISHLLTGKDGPAHRLVTLTGAGGIGKTRLALETARVVAKVGTLYFAALSDLRDAASIAGRVAESVVPCNPSSGFSKPADPLERVIAHLSSISRPLLVLDNLEHLVETGGAAFVLTLLSRVSALSILATSRRRLFVAGEREWPVTPLSLPPGISGGRENTAAGLTPETVLGSAAAQLFVDRAQAARPDFQITVRNASTVAAICCRLDGLPLALELVAARAQSLTPAQMLQGLSQQVAGSTGLAATNRRDREERHRSLQEAIAWSVDLLPPALARFWMTLSVFRDGFTASAAAAVTEEPYALEYLTQLRERSLLQAEEAGDVLRFRMLETLREFAEERLSPEERERFRSNAAAYFVRWIEEAAAEPHRVQTASWLTEVDSEQENLRTTLAWCAAKPQIAQGIQLSGALWNYWQPRGFLTEGRSWLERFLCHFDTAAEQQNESAPGMTTLYLARALRAAGTLALRQSDFEDAEAFFQQTLTIWRQAGNENRVADALNNLGGLASRRGDYPTAHAFLSEGLAILRVLSDKRGISSALNNLGTVTHFLGRSESALALYQECVALKREIGEYGSLVTALNNAAQVALHLEDGESAKRLAHEALSLVQERGDLTATADLLETFIQITVDAGEWNLAANLIGAAVRLRERIGAPLTAADQATLDHQVAAVQNALLCEVYTAAFAEGQAMRVEEIFTLLSAVAKEAAD